MKNQKLKMPAWVVILGLVFGLSVLGVSVTRQAAAHEHEQDHVDVIEEMEVGEEENKQELVMMPETEMESEAVDYYLPYPGILPDHPMYWLKMVRDRVQLLLTTNEVKKAEKQLLYADKRLGAGWALVEGNKIQLGVTTLTKAEKYLEQALMSVSQLQAEDRLFEKVNKASKKHKEVLMIVKNKVGDEYSSVIDQMLEVGEGIRPLNSVKNIEEGMVKTTLVIDDGETVVEFSSKEALTALELLRKGVEDNQMEVVVKEYDFGSLVESIKGMENTEEKAWIYYVNGESGTVGADQYELKDGDVIEWRYTEPIF